MASWFMSHTFPCFAFMSSRADLADIDALPILQPLEPESEGKRSVRRSANKNTVSYCP